ncbi:HNH endonuclease [Paramixta manurensis]|uniref:HNH endonuclease n=1 Tax=Paramixta manurensis TaxID=2740817 RepID=A0A6M8UA51_9GAMM|nr:HNH endonuclease [Erwiniaceae bacterium PD-1]
MRFNYDLVPGEFLTFEEISRRYAQRYPDEKALTLRGLLSPSTSPRHLVIRAVFAHQDTNSPLEDLLFVSEDNQRKNYLRRFEHYLIQQIPFLYFRKAAIHQQENDWKVMGESRVYAMLEPGSAAAQNLLTSRGYKLSLMRQEQEEEYWQLFNTQAQPCFAQSRRIQFIVVLAHPLVNPPASVIAGQGVGHRVKMRIWQRESQSVFSNAVRARYGACVVTGTVLNDEKVSPWVEASYIDTTENEQGVIADNHVDNGLFLRSDLHHLFESRKFYIDAQSGEVVFRCLTPEEAELCRSYQEINGEVCALWERVPFATRQRLRLRHQRAE